MKTNNFFDHNNHLSETGISLYVDAIKLNRLSDLPKDLIHHVEECTECKMQILEVSAILENAHYDMTIPHPYFDSSTPKILPLFTPYRIAAGFIIALFAGTAYYLSSDKGNKPEEISQHSRSAESTYVEQIVPKQEKSDDLLAANFDPSPILDDLVGMELRSEVIEVLLPKIGDVVNFPVTFRWKQYDKPLTIYILSNKDLVLLRASTKGNSYTTDRKFAPGLYYWKLLSGDELLYVGKFLVQ